MPNTTQTLAHQRLVAALRAARRAAGLDQKSVAKRLRRPQSFVARMESGDRRIDVIELSQLCRIYKVNLLRFIADLEL